MAILDGLAKHVVVFRFLVLGVPEVVLPLAKRPMPELFAQPMQLLLVEVSAVGTLFRGLQRRRVG